MNKHEKAKEYIFLIVWTAASIFATYHLYQEGMSFLGALGGGVFSGLLITCFGFAAGALGITGD